MRIRNLEVTTGVEQHPELIKRHAFVNVERGQLLAYVFGWSLLATW